MPSVTRPPFDRRALERAVAYVDSWLQWRCPRSDLPGCVVAVAHRGRVLLCGAYGHADLASGRRLRSDDIFRIASHSKSFTATAVMQLHERGRLHLDDAASQHLGWLARHRDHRFRQVTVRQLLSHGAGVMRDGKDADHWQFRRPFPDRDQLRDEVLDAELVTDPNVAMKYSNIGYGLVGLVIEEVSGYPYDEYLQSHVITPLGLAHTAAELRPDMARRAVTGYTRRDGQSERRPVPSADTRALAPATGVASTAADLCAYFTAHFVGSRQLLGDVAKREMQRVQWHVHRPAPGLTQDYGLGFALDTVGEHKTFGHGGGFPGQATRSFADPGRELVVVALTSCIDGPAQEICRGVFGIVDHFQAGAVESPRRGLRRLEGRYLNLWSVMDLVVAGKEATAICPDSWDPMADTERLEPVDATTLRITEASSYGSPGELVRFSLEDGAVRNVTWAGYTAWPAAHWSRQERALLRP